MHVSYFFSKPSIMKRMVSYNLHYLFPAGFTCVYVSFKAPMFLYCIVSVYHATKITKNTFVHSKVFTEYFPDSNLCYCLFKLLQLCNTDAVASWNKVKDMQCCCKIPRLKLAQLSKQITTLGCLV